MARIVHERADIIPALAEVFREHGFAGTSLALIGIRTGLGKGSLYHFFPGGKEEMAEAVLAHIDRWFEDEMFRPLRDDPDPHRAIALMLKATQDYFRSGNRVCVVGVFALGEERDRFGVAVEGYFVRWVEALAGALTRAGHGPDGARALAEEAVGAIQGALVLARATGEPALFVRTLDRLRRRLGL